MRWIALCALIVVLVGCRTWVDHNPLPKVGVFDSGPSITFEDYIGRQRVLNEKYLYGTPLEARKAAEGLLELEKAYAKNGQRPIESDHGMMLANTRLFVMAEKLRERPEAEMYLAEALKYARKWKPELKGMAEERQVSFIRSYIDEFEKGLEVRWKKELK